MFRTFNLSFLFVAISYGLGGAAQAATVTFNTFTSPPLSMAPDGTIGFAYAGNEFVGSIYLNGTGSLYSTDLNGGNAQAFAPSVNLNSSTGEHYVAASFGLGGFPSGDIYAANGTSITHITNNGASSNTFVSGLNGEVRGITFDLVGTFGNDMLVTTSLGSVYKVNSTGVATQLANVGEDVEGLNVAPLGNNFATFDGQLIVASEGSGMLRAISSGGVVTPLSNGGSGGLVLVPSAEELTFVPLNLGASGSSLEGLYGSNYAQRNVQKANENQFLGLQGDIIVTGELTGDVSDVHWNGSQFIVSQVGSFGSYPSNQPEDGVFVIPAMVTPEPSSLALVVAGLISLLVWRVRSHVVG